MKEYLRNIVEESLKDEVHVDGEWNRLMAAIVKQPGDIVSESPEDFIFSDDKICCCRFCRSLSFFFYVLFDKR